MEYPRRYCPVCNSTVPKEFLPGPGGRPDASCPVCGSLERHRFLSVLIDALRPALGEVDVLLDVAPSPQVTPMLGRVGARRHVRVDLGADSRLVDVLASLTDAPFGDDSVDLMVCFHVLEHIPDDRAAMREIARILRPGGLAIVQVPWRPERATDEDPDAGPEERTRRFGRVDHVRYYGADFEDRLIECGLALRRVTPRSLLGDAMSAWLKLVPTEMVWLLTPSAHPAPIAEAGSEPTSLRRALDALAGELDTQWRTAERETARAEQAERTVWDTHGRPVARRLVAKAGRATRAARRRLR